MAELLRVEALRAGYGEAVVIEALDLALDDGRSLAVLGRNGAGKTTLVNALIGAVTASGRVALAGVDLSRLPPHAPGARRRRLVPAGAQYLPLADRRREPHRRRAARPVESRARLPHVSAPRGAARQSGRPALRRRAADAGDRPRADGQPAAAAARRADRGPGAGDRRRTAGGAEDRSPPKACR